jgi:hypothetical protein
LQIRLRFFIGANWSVATVLPVRWKMNLHCKASAIIDLKHCSPPLSRLSDIRRERTFTKL